jgi:hypothetical protein
VKASTPCCLTDADVDAEDRLRRERAGRGSYVGCIAGALSAGEDEDGLRRGSRQRLDRRVLLRRYAEDSRLGE